MRLIHEPTGSEIKPGDKVETFRGEEVTLTSFDARRIYVKDARGQSREYFHSVILSRVVES